MTYGFRVFLCKCDAHLHNSCWQRPPPPLAPRHSHSPQNSYCHMQPHWSKILHIQNESQNGRCSIPTSGALLKTLPRQFTDMGCSAGLGFANVRHLSKPSATNDTEELPYQGKTSFCFRPHCSFKSARMHLQIHACHHHPRHDVYLPSGQELLHTVLAAKRFASPRLNGSYLPAFDS